MPAPLFTHEQPNAYTSPWSLRRRVGLLFWNFTWAVGCSWTPKPLNPWRLFILRLFGAKVAPTAFVHQRVRIQQPWNLTMHHRACLGDAAEAYTLGEIVLQEDCTIAQEAYLCTGTHDFRQTHRPLQTAPIIVEKRAFVGARAFVMPGIRIGADSIVGAGAIVTKDVAPRAIVAGNPARVIGQRTFLPGHEPSAEPAPGLPI